MPDCYMKAKLALRSLAGVLVLSAGLFWLSAGANRGWTRTSIPVKTVDEITGIEGIDYRKQFVPGVDFLGLAVVTAGFLAGASFLIRHRSTNHIAS
jgi:hypothetical protein